MDPHTPAVNKSQQLAEFRRQHRVERPEEQNRHHHVKDAPVSRLTQPPLQSCPEHRPNTDARCVNHSASQRNDQNQCDIRLRGEVVGGSADSHNPRFRVNPLEQCCAEETERFTPRLAGGRGGGCRDPPGKPDQIQRPNNANNRVERWEGSEQLRETEPDREHQQGKPNDDSGDVGQGSFQTEVNPGREQHQVVRPGRDRGDEGVKRQREQGVDWQGESRKRV